MVSAPPYETKYHGGVMGIFLGVKNNLAVRPTIFWVSFLGLPAALLHSTGSRGWPWTPGLASPDLRLIITIVMPPPLANINFRLPISLRNQTNGNGLDNQPDKHKADSSQRIHHLLRKWFNRCGRNSKTEIWKSHTDLYADVSKNWIAFLSDYV